VITPQEFIAKYAYAPRDDWEKKGGDAKNYTTKVSSGTTSGRPTVNARFRDFKESQHFTVPDNLFRRPVFYFDYITGAPHYLGDFMFNRKLAEEALCLNSRDLKPGLREILLQYAPDIYIGPPPYAMKLFSYINGKQNQPYLTSLKFIWIFGERLTPHNENILRTLMPHTRIYTQYGLSELGMITFPLCNYRKLNTHHPREHLKVEILNADYNGVGDIAISKEIKKGLYIERYLTGDKGKLIDAPCPCGRPILFEIMGRNDLDYIQIGNIVLRQEYLDNVLPYISDYVEDYRAELRLKKVRGIEKIDLKIHILPKIRLRKRLKPEELLEGAFMDHLTVTFVNNADSVPYHELVHEGQSMKPTCVLTNELPPLQKNIKLRKK
jgi:phenylacetate-coenzyme A ligase PaaK-like adenylate-forming protein